jgi:hypothetical protein
MTRAFTGKPTCVSLAAAAKVTANSLAGTLTSAIRGMEGQATWQNSKELRHWHTMFSQARQCLLTRPPERANRNQYTELEIFDECDDDCPNSPSPAWQDLVGVR